MEQTQPNQPDFGAPRKRPPFLTTGFPKRSEGRKVGWVASFVAHLLILLLLLAPVLLESDIIQEAVEGAGGPGPAGGGGGGTNGTGGGAQRNVHEQLQYIQVAPAPAPAVEPEPEVVEPAPIPPPETPQPEPEPVQPPVVELAQLLPEDGPRVMAATGTGGGTGTDGTAGTGPGKGGGVGSGIGTGRGSGVGPGSGGGNAEIHPPFPIHLFPPPLPVPDKVRGFELVARFDVDERGSARLLGFNPTPDRDYNRRLREVLISLRWRPATRLDGTPIRQITTITLTL